MDPLSPESHTDYAALNEQDEEVLPPQSLSKTRRDNAPDVNADGSATVQGAVSLHISLDDPIADPAPNGRPAGPAAVIAPNGTQALAPVAADKARSVLVPSSRQSDAAISPAGSPVAVLAPFASGRRYPFRNEIFFLIFILNVAGVVASAVYYAMSSERGEGQVSVRYYYDVTLLGVLVGSVAAFLTAHAFYYLIMSDRFKDNRVILSLSFHFFVVGIMIIVFITLEKALYCTCLTVWMGVVLLYLFLTRDSLVYNEYMLSLSVKILHSIESGSALSALLPRVIVTALLSGWLIAFNNILYYASTCWLHPFHLVLSSRTHHSFFILNEYCFLSFSRLLFSP